MMVEDHGDDYYKPDVLKDYISNDVELFGETRLLDQFEQEGYVVLRGVLTKDECLVELNRLWDFVEATSPRISRHDPTSWYPKKRHQQQQQDVKDLKNDHDYHDNDNDHDHDDNNDHHDQEDDPWPHSGWKFLMDMCQSYQSGWLFSDLRERLAKRVFEPLYETHELHSSKEGFTFLRPTDTTSIRPFNSIIKNNNSNKKTDSHNDQNNNIDTTTTTNDDHSNNSGYDYVHPLYDLTIERPRVCNELLKVSQGEHFDQRSSHIGLQCIQSSTCFIDQTAEDGNFLCWPGSHKEHPTLTKHIWRGRSDWVPLRDEELLYLKNKGYRPKRIPVKAGDVILWRSDLCHCGASPTKPTTTFRAVSYTCMLPAQLTPSNVYNNKLNDFWLGVSGDHRPNVFMEHLSVPKRQTTTKKNLSSSSAIHKTIKGEEQIKPVLTMTGGRYFGSGYPQLTWRQAELYGLVKYGGTDQPNEINSKIQINADGSKTLLWIPPLQQSNNKDQ